jgi:hypothetical protein
MEQPKLNNEVAIQPNDRKEVLSKINEEIASLVEDQAIMTCPRNGERIKKVVKNFMASIQQGDEVETMLLGQMLATHNLAMLMLTKGGVELDSWFREDFKATNSAVKLLNAFTRQMEVLKSYRGKTSTQKIIVEQVKVESGGQAIVGTIATGGGSTDGRDEKK